MVTKARASVIQVTKETNLAELIDTMSAADVALERKGKRYRLVRESVVVKDPSERPKDGIWANYDPEKARIAIQQARGAFHNIDADKLIADLRDQRGQDSTGRDDLGHHAIPR
jgi:hypothetical protein